MVCHADTLVQQRDCLLQPEGSGDEVIVLFDLLFKLLDAVIDQLAGDDNAAGRARQRPQQAQSRNDDLS